jgi:hypothetical protein
MSFRIQTLPTLDQLLADMVRRIEDVERVAGGITGGGGFAGGGGGGAPIDSAYALASASPSRPTNSRVLVAGTNISLADGGPGGNLTISASGGGGGIGGGGTINRIAKFTASTTIGDSAITESGGIVDLPFLQINAVNSGILWTATSGNYFLALAGSGMLKLAIAGIIRFSFATNGMYFPDGTFQSTAYTGAGGVGGSGTQYYLAMWTATTTIGNAAAGASCYVNGYLLPTPTNSFTLGDAAHTWSQVWTNRIQCSAGIIEVYVQGNRRFWFDYGGYNASQAHLWPAGDDTYNLGATDHRWLTCHAVDFYGTLHAGPDLYCSDMRCPSCKQNFLPRDEITFVIRQVLKGRKGLTDEIAYVPKHQRCHVAA